MGLKGGADCLNEPKAEDGKQASVQAASWLPEVVTVAAVAGGVPGALSLDHG